VLKTRPRLHLVSEIRGHGLGTAVVRCLAASTPLGHTLGRHGLLTVAQALCRLRLARSNKAIPAITAMPP
jgi:hypothetical protein